MLGSKRRKLRTTKIDSLIGRHTEALGDLRFSGGLHIDGVVRGNVYADDDSGAVLTLSEFGTVEGEIRVPNVVLSGTVIGDVHARDQIELGSSARITGNVYYRLIEMAMGAEVNGSLVHCGPDGEAPNLQLEHGGTLDVGRTS
jgi:cytoskeletal protein CcmA (bactofilin family)